MSILGGFILNFIFKFENLAILTFFLSHFGFRFSIKGVLLWCLMDVRVDKKIIQNFLCLVIVIYDFLCTWSMKKM